MFEYLPEKNSLIDMNGVREIQAREDLQEPESKYWRNKSEQIRKELEMRRHNQEPVSMKALFGKEVETWKSTRGQSKKNL